jgi:hypothetical protein
VVVSVVVRSVEDIYLTLSLAARYKYPSTCRMVPCAWNAVILYPAMPHPMSMFPATKTMNSIIKTFECLVSCLLGCQRCCVCTVVVYL